MCSTRNRDPPPPPTNKKKEVHWKFTDLWCFSDLTDFCHECHFTVSESRVKFIPLGILRFKDDIDFCLRIRPDLSFLKRTNTRNNDYYCNCLHKIGNEDLSSYDINKTVT